MQHWIIAVIAPLTELNPIAYVTDVEYRRKATSRLGRRARRIFIYQILLASISTIAVVTFGRG
ncbi:hypothetical protein LVB87_06065 [Lysobacter sp. KIS68-7]|uniref:hypothetical protein n=1 Tax=Lysobacter sp. KIS68-7 TaxID=2904252 RepID=UPI001E3F934F|nr:hypothetical protein [Lysobacter sp. KIS68-7]UHQ20705.1 hypothetical protein LVB87_06065 [Lysobacter sp. KIS68-7]